MPGANRLCSFAAQAICNDAVRPKLASQMCMIFVDKPLGQLASNSAHWHDEADPAALVMSQPSLV